MKTRHYEDMNLQELDVVEEMDNIGISHAVTVLSKLPSKEIRIMLPEVDVLGYKEAVFHTGSPEEIIVAALVKMDKGMEGLTFFLFNLGFTSTMLDKLVGGSFSDSTELDEISYSALAEAGNIIIRFYINVFSQLVGIEAELSVLSATVSMLGGVLTVPIAKYGYKTDKLIYFNADLAVEGKKLPEWLLMLPDTDSLNGILDRLRIL